MLRSATINKENCYVIRKVFKIKIMTLMIYQTPTLARSQATKLTCATLPIVKGGSTLVTLPRNVTPYRDSVNGARDHVTYQKLVTRSRYRLVRCAVGIWPSHQRDDMVTAGASVDVQLHAARPHLLRLLETLRGHEPRSHCHDTV